MAQQSNIWEGFFGSNLQGKNGSIPVSDLAKNEVVGIYFSAHWCPPCKMFTPLLADFYKTHHAAKNFEIVFVSSDRDEGAFDHYYGEMPWVALPYANRDKKAELAKKYKVQGIPSFVLVDKNGNTITSKARESVMADKEAKDFPWHPKSVWDILKGDILVQGGQKADTVSHLKTQTAFGIYFSAHWCGPCRQFTPKLTQTYKALKAQGKQFEVVFVSGDNSQHEFDEYFGGMPWTAIPFTDKKRIEELNSHFEVEGIPHFVLLDGTTGKVITKNARGAVEDDPEGKDFPWFPKPLNTIDAGAAELNDASCLILLNSAATDADIQTLQKVAAEYAQKWSTKDDKPLLFLYGKDSPMTTRVKTFTNIPDKTLFVLSIPEGKKFVHDGDFSEQSIKQFVEAYLAGSLKSKGIKE